MEMTEMILETFKGLISDNLLNADLSETDRDLHQKLLVMINEELAIHKATGKTLFRIWAENPKHVELIQSLPLPEGVELF